jgi:nucleoside-diphosphate-sugar epimerase
VRRYIQQASGFFLKPGSGLADESEELAVDASPGVAASARTYAELEARVLSSGGMDGVVLRYGFFYGPNTWYCPEGAAAKRSPMMRFMCLSNSRRQSFQHRIDPL